VKSESTEDKWKDFGEVVATGAQRSERDTWEANTLPLSYARVA